LVNQPPPNTTHTYIHAYIHTLDKSSPAPLIHLQQLRQSSAVPWHASASSHMAPDGTKSPSISPSGNHCLLRLPGEKDHAQSSLVCTPTSLTRATTPHSLQQLLSAPVPSVIQPPATPKTF
ncbi:hypothetical protein COCMIDRAFT_107777, partial [Bipolaris oryzae ATCC 44560]